MTTWFTSDMHYGHRNIIRYCARPFADVDEMRETMVTRWNEVVRPEDTVYVLGDFSLDQRQPRQVLPRLLGEKHLIVGNHDLCHPRKPKGVAKNTRMYLDAGFATVELESFLEVDGYEIRLHHMPYRGDSHEQERYHEWRPQDMGHWLFHGHVHEKWKTRDRMINVGVDQWDFRPVALETLMEIVHRT